MMIIKNKIAGMAFFPLLLIFLTGLSFAQNPDTTDKNQPNEISQEEAVLLKEIQKAAVVLRHGVNQKECINAMNYLLTIEHPDSVSVISEGIRENRIAVKLAGIKALENFPKTRQDIRETLTAVAVPVLIECTKDVTPAVRQEAAIALGALEDLAILGLNALGNLLYDNAIDRNYVIDAFQNIKSISAGPILREALKIPERNIRIRIIETLGVIGDPSAIAQIDIYLRDRDRDVRLTAVNVLAKWKLPEARATLEKMLNDPEDIIKDRVREILSKGGGENLSTLISIISNSSITLNDRLMAADTIINIIPKLTEKEKTNTQALLESTLNSENNNDVKIAIILTIMHLKDLNENSRFYRIIKESNIDIIIPLFEKIKSGKISVPGMLSPMLDSFAFRNSYKYKSEVINNRESIVKISGSPEDNMKVRELAFDIVKNIISARDIPVLMKKLVAHRSAKESAISQMDLSSIPEDKRKLQEESQIYELAEKKVDELMNQFTNKDYLDDIMLALTEDNDKVKLLVIEYIIKINDPSIVIKLKPYTDEGSEEVALKVTNAFGFFAKEEKQFKIDASVSENNTKAPATMELIDITRRRTAHTSIREKAMDILSELMNKGTISLEDNLKNIMLIATANQTPAIRVKALKELDKIKDINLLKGCTYQLNEALDIEANPAIRDALIKSIKIIEEKIKPPKR